MKKAINIIFAVFFLLQTQESCDAFFKKNKTDNNPKAPMVHTVEEWMESATSVNLDMRENEETEENKDSKVILPSKKPSVIEKYNTYKKPKELDLTFLLKDKIIRSDFISDPNFNNAVYTETEYYSQTRQVASSVYLVEEDFNLSNKEKLEKLNIFNHKRYLLISTQLPHLKEGFFSTLTVVDFSSDGKKLIVKEKRGSNKYGLYETFVWVYYLTDEKKEENECYLNNLSFSKDLISFYNKEDNNQKIPSLSDYNRDFDFSSLKNPPSFDIFHYKNENIKSNGIKNLSEYPKEEQMSSYPLSYQDLNGFILASLKQNEMTSLNKTRFYNSYPKDYKFKQEYKEGSEKGFGVRLNLLNETIKAYWLQKNNLILNHIRWDLIPLGFNTNVKDEVVVESFAYLKDGKKVSLGIWGVNTANGIIRLIEEGEKIQIEQNALILVDKLN